MVSRPGPTHYNVSLSLFTNIASKKSIAAFIVCTVLLSRTDFPAVMINRSGASVLKYGRARAR